ncbi:MAG: LptA/OstA family protein [Pseudomonadota bacterium]
MITLTHYIASVGLTFHARLIGRLAFVMACLGLALLLGPSAAFAQTLADGLGGFTQQSSDPIEIEADELEVLDEQNLAIFRGNVRVVQGTAILTSSELRVHYQGNASGDSIGPTSSQGLRLLEASGGVTVTSEDQYAEGEEGRFDFEQELITLSGEVLLRQGENEVRGERLTVDLKTRQSRLDAAARAAGSQRVTGVFMPGSQSE